MIVTDEFAFIHLPRTGGTFIAHVISKFFPSAHKVGHHLPRDLMPNKFHHLPVLCTVRNPWDFYVSLYHYLWPREASSALASWMTENGRLGFTGSIRNLLNIGVDNERLDVLVDMLPEHIDYEKRYIPSVTKAVMRTARGSGLGYYTFRFNQMLGNADDVFICRLENLNHDLVTFFDSIGVGTAELRDYVLNSKKVNAAEHFHYSTYYEPEIVELVSLRDRALIERFNYFFEQSTSLGASSPN